MQTLSHTIRITDDEKELIGDALCFEIKNTVEKYAVLNDMDETRLMVETELDLLHALTNIGYKMWVDAENFIDGYSTSDTDEWFESVYTEATSSKVEQVGV